DALIWGLVVQRVLFSVAGGANEDFRVDVGVANQQEHGRRHVIDGEGRRAERSGRRGCAALSESGVRAGAVGRSTGIDALVVVGIQQKALADLAQVGRALHAVGTLFGGVERR